MHFKHPEVLYALVALIIPIIVHLFKLKKFKKQYFTNVSLIQKIVSESRRSSQLKKWLLLFTRLCLLTSLILAFAEPFFPRETTSTNQSLYIVLDNSLSMSGKAGNVSILKQVKQQLVDVLPQQESFNLITNNQDYNSITVEDFKELSTDILPISKNFSLKEVALKLNNVEATSQVILISDFYNSSAQELQQLVKRFPQLQLINVAQPKAKNVSLIDAQLINNELQVKLKSSVSSASTSLGLYQAQKLMGKLDVNFEDDTLQTVNFNINEADLQALKLEINDDFLDFDNLFYASKSKIKTNKVLIISNKNAEYLTHIYQPNLAFKSQVKSSEELNLEDFKSADVIIVNQLEQIDLNLTNNLDQALDESKNVIIIPATSTEAQNTYLNLQLQNKQIFSSVVNQKQSIISINFNHPIYKDVFTNTITNFDYPSTAINYAISEDFSSILSYGNTAFYAQSEHLFVFASEIKSKQSNFYNSPLIVPTFIQSADYKNSNSSLFYFTDRSQPIIVNQEISGDQVLKLKSGKMTFIPQQQKNGTQTELTINNLNLNPELYAVTLNQDTIAQLSFNLPREESELNPIDFKLHDINTVTIPQSIENYKQLTTEAQLWKWFITFALLFLGIEIAIVRILN